MKMILIYALALLISMANLQAEDTTRQDAMRKLRERPDLLAAWNEMHDSSLSDTNKQFYVAKLRLNVKKLINSQDDDIRVLTLLTARRDSMDILENNFSPQIKDATFLAKALLANASIGKWEPGWEETISQIATINVLAKKLRTSLSVSGKDAFIEQKQEKKTHAEVVGWLQALTQSLLDDKNATNDQRDAARKIQSIMLKTEPQPFTDFPPLATDRKTDELLPPTALPDEKAAESGQAAAAKPTLHKPRVKPWSFATWGIIAVVILAIVILILRRKWV